MNHPFFIFSLILAAVLISIWFGYIWGKDIGRDELEGEMLEELAAFEEAMLASEQQMKELHSAMVPHLENSQRYQLVRYYLENDHGGLAINAFYGPGAITTAMELDATIDTELDERNAQIELAAIEQLAKDLGVDLKKK